jgi:ATP-independent RNA helicase DbpA
VRQQAAQLERGAQVAVGTPGRIVDHLQRRNLRVHGVHSVVLDEADRMLDMGFLEDVSKILNALPKERQTVFFSATFPPSIGELCSKYQHNPLHISAQQTGEAPPSIEQRVVHIAGDKKFEILLRVLDHYAAESTLVFANLKVNVADIEGALAARGISVASLHGDLEQFDRDRVMAKFRNGSTRVLVATDVAARGIDLEQLDLVVNFALPRQAEVYIHRIGRTGRAGHAGIAVSLCTAGEGHILGAIEATTGERLVPLEPVKVTENRRRLSGSGPKMATLRVSGGRKDKVRPGDILGALTGEAGGLAGTDIGKIEIHDRFAYVAVEMSVSPRALESLQNGKIKGKRFRVELVS